jgi:hypothetical protein
MRIGILTFQRALNYGAFLQAFATKSFLSGKGYNVEIVDYWPKEHADYVNKHKLTASSPLGKVKQLTFYSLCEPLFRRRRLKMSLLRHKYLGIFGTPKYKKGEELSQTSFDAVIYGSDQIWWNHTAYSHVIAYDKTYWGFYLPKKTKRIAYAPSMGIIDIREEDQAFIREALNNFDYLSTRETNLRDALRPYTDKPITTVLDPVFLPNKEFWLRHIKKRRIKERYLLYYSLIPTPDSHAHAAKLAKAKGLKLIEITPRIRDFRLSSDLIQTADALDFISLIHHADYIVSTSFHGTAMSIILEKEFCVVGLGKRSGRVVSLLTQLGISERYTDHPDSLSNIDYIDVRERLEKLQNISRDYLIHALTEQ